MSVGLFKYDGDIKDRNSKVALSKNIASESFYEKHWELAIAELGIKFIQDGANFDRSKLEPVLKELDLLKKWSLEKLQGSDLEYMRSRVENLQEVIPKVFDEDENAILHIF